MGEKAQASAERLSRKKGLKRKATCKLGVVGLGAMGSSHARSILDGLVPRCELAAVCDRKKSVAAADFPGIPFFDNPASLIDSGTADAVLICTPHDSHADIGIAALEAGLHVLVEKPIAVEKAEALKLLAAHRRPEQVFAAMFNQRTDPVYRKLRQLVTSGELGQIHRVNWTATHWFRTEAYYAQGGWRATWAGEGGGVLLNQCPHNLDLFQWIFGMPSKVRGFCQFGRYHKIEVEDDVTAYFEYPDGMTGVFIASTGEAPGTNRLEIAAERGRMVVEDGRIEFRRNKIPATEFSRTTDKIFARPPVHDRSIRLPSHRGQQHIGILKNFTNSILRGETLLSPAAEGIHSVELANAILLSSVESTTVELPLSAPRYAKLLARLKASSGKTKNMKSNHSTASARRRGKPANS
jgi:predicted dehydrogenase